MRKIENKNVWEKVGELTRWLLAVHSFSSVKVNIPSYLPPCNGRGPHSSGTRWIQQSLVNTPDCFLHNWIHQFHWTDSHKLHCACKEHRIQNQWTSSALRLKSRVGPSSQMQYITLWFTASVFGVDDFNRDNHLRHVHTLITKDKKLHSE